MFGNVDFPLSWFSMFWSLNIRFDDHSKMLLLSERVLETIFDVLEKMCLCFGIRLFVVKKSIETPPQRIVLPNLKNRNVSKCFLDIGCQAYFLKCSFRYRLNGQRLKTNNRFPWGSKKRKFNNDDKHGHDQEKMGPSTYVERIMHFWKIDYRMTNFQVPCVKK